MGQIDLPYDLLNYIVELGLEPGNRLPAISELASEEHLGVSTSKVREQLEVARALGLVEVRSKTGTRLKPFSFAPAARLSLFIAMATDIHHFEQFSQLRTHIEVAFWREACKLLTEADIQDMQACIDRARDKLASHPIQIPNEEHREFHLTIFQRLENPFVTGLLEAYWDAYDAVAVSRYADYSYLQTVWNFHEQILKSIKEGDFAGACELFEKHTELLQYELPRLHQSEQLEDEEGGRH